MDYKKKIIISRIIVVLSLPLLFRTCVFAKERGSEFGCAVNSRGNLLTITSITTTNGMWLGVTFYPPLMKDSVKASVSKLVPIRKGYNKTEIPIPAEYRNGTIEAAIWRKKLSRSEIPLEDVASRNIGYKLTGMVSYLWAHLTAQ